MTLKFYYEFLGACQYYCSVDIMHSNHFLLETQNNILLC